MKRLVMTLVLTGLLSASAMAGDMHGTDSPAPAPSPTPHGITSTPQGQILAAPGYLSTADSAEATFEDALSAILSVLGVVL